MAKLEDWQVTAIEDYLSVCKVSGGLIVGRWTGDELFTLIEKVRAKEPWGDMLDVFDVVELTTRLLGRLTPPVSKEYAGVLRDAPNSAVCLAAMREEVVRFLESLPRTYYTYFPMVSLPTIGQAELPLTADIAIIDTSHPGAMEAVLLVNEVSSLQDAMLGRASAALTPDARYVRIRTTGFANNSLTSEAVASAVAQLKHFAFISLASNVFKEEHIYARQPRLLSAVVSCIDVGDRERYGVHLPEELARFLARLQPNMETLRYHDLTAGSTILGATARAPGTPGELAIALKVGYAVTDSFLAIPRETLDVQRIKAAMEWWIDAVAVENQTIAFLEFCLGFEALLGDSDGNGNRSPERGITERLSDRYAYLMGRTQSEREEHRKAFAKFYKRRGQIVHQRETHLRRSQDAAACGDARRMLYNAIAQELNSFVRATRTKT